MKAEAASRAGNPKCSCGTCEHTEVSQDGEGGGGGGVSIILVAGWLSSSKGRNIECCPSGRNSH